MAKLSKLNEIAGAFSKAIGDAEAEKRLKKVKAKGANQEGQMGKVYPAGNLQDALDEGEFGMIDPNTGKPKKKR